MSVVGVTHEWSVVVTDGNQTGSETSVGDLRRRDPVAYNVRTVISRTPWDTRFFTVMPIKSLLYDSRMTHKP